MALLAFNEEESLPIAVKASLEAGRKFAEKSDLSIVVYEGSTDNTLNVARGLAKKHKNTKVVLQKKGERGYGVALRLAVANASREFFFYTDADNQFNLGDIGKLLPYLNEADVVTGYRVNRKDPALRGVIAEAYNWFVWAATGYKFVDVDAAFKVYKRKIFKDFALESRTGMIDAEILAKALAAGHDVKEVPIEHRARLHGTPVFQGNKLGMVKWSVVKGLLEELNPLARGVAELRKKAKRAGKIIRWED